MTEPINAATSTSKATGTEGTDATPPETTPVYDDLTPIEEVIRLTKEGHTYATADAPIREDTGGIGQEWLTLNDAALRLGVTRPKVEEYATHLLPDDRWHPENMTLLQSIVASPAEIRVRFGAIQTLHEHALHEQAVQQPEQPTITPTVEPPMINLQEELQSVDRELSDLEERRQVINKEIDSLGFHHTQFGNRRSGDRRNDQDRRGPERSSAGRRARDNDRRKPTQTRQEILSAEMSRLVESIEALTTRRTNLMEMINEASPA